MNGQVVVELKAKSSIHPVDKAQVLSNLRLLHLRFGLLINFHEERVVDGVSRIVNGYGNDEHNISKHRGTEDTEF